jgi:hypothetical protein
MVAVGVFYLAFERKLLAKSRMSGDSTAPADNLLSRSLIGAQVGKSLAPPSLYTKRLLDRTDSSRDGCHKI